MLKGLFFTTEEMKKKMYKCLNEMKCLVYTVLYLVYTVLYCVILFYVIKTFKTIYNFLFFYFFIFLLWRWTNSNLNLFELIHLDKKKKTKEMKNQTCLFLKILFQYTRKSAASITCVLKIVLIFRNIRQCKPPWYNASIYLSW